MESNYNSLITLLNVVICIINMLILILTIKQYRQCSQLGANEPTEFIISDTETLSAPVLNESEKEEIKRSEVLISKLTEDRLIEEFRKAHANRFFLKKGISLNDLAALLSTNQRYTSYIVNMQTGMDFNNYVQHARITYLIEKVERDPELLNVKFSTLAEDAGFSSISKFSSVFKAVIGIPPSEYFQKKSSKD